MLNDFIALFVGAFNQFAPDSPLADEYRMILIIIISALVILVSGLLMAEMIKAVFHAFWNSFK